MYSSKSPPGADLQIANRLYPVVKENILPHAFISKILSGYYDDMKLIS